MNRTIVDYWLLSLCDSEGYRDLPKQRLDSRQVALLLHSAEEHGITGVVSKNLRSVIHCEGSDRLLIHAGDLTATQMGLEELDQQCLSEVAMTLMLRSRAKQVIDALRREKLPVALTKGQDFADRLYHQPHLRTFRDIDLMLPRRVIDTVSGTMSSLGFRFLWPEGKYNQEYGERTWDSLTAPLARVELHWNMINCPSQRRRSSLSFEELNWEAIDGDLRASPSSMLLIACVHAAISHRFDRLQHLCDIRQICRGRAGNLDYESIREAAIRQGLVGAIAGALAVTSRLLCDKECREALEHLRLPGYKSSWQLLVSSKSLLRPGSRVSKLRRTVLREWMKHAA